MSKKIAISVVIPNWNGEPLLKKNLPSVVEAKNYSANHIMEIVVVDDGSFDGSVTLLERDFAKEVRLIKHKINRGFSNAVNTGARFSEGTHICLLNTDVVPDTNFLAHSIEYLADENVFGITLNEGNFGPATALFDGYFKHSSKEPKNEIQDTLWISGGSGVFSKSIWKELKGMDYELFSPFYWEDVDLGYRAHKRGYRLLWDPKAKVDHRHESVINSSNFRKQYLNIIKERNELLFIWKNITSKNLTKKHRDALLSRLKSHPGYIKVVLAALLKFPAVRRKRKREIEQSSVSDEAVFTKFS